MSQHHPDKLIAKGLPDEMIKIAKEKITTNVKEIRPPNCLTGSGNNFVNL